MKTREVENIFAEVLERAKVLDPVNTRRWFDDLKLLHLNSGSMEIGCPNEAIVEFLRDNCAQSFTHAAQYVTGHLVTVGFSVDHHGDDLDSASEQGPALKLHPDYTFDHFVVGPSNRLAHASCVAVSHSPGNTYNPLFVYGNSGLGKTHLLHAVCADAGQKFEKATILFLSCEDFINRFIHAIQEGELAMFQRQFRNVNMLIIDDVQFLREREQSQEEFFHTFNALYNNGRQIILSADCSPSEIPSLEERLISRFKWGLVARIDPPSYETRVAIVRKKAQLRGITVSEEVAEYVGRKIHANIRELEGALTNIYAVSATTGRDITLELAQTALDGQIEAAARSISITDIVEVVTDHFDVRLTDLQSKRRSQSITMPRRICMYLARNLTRHSLEEIGGHLGGRDHTTVMHACRKIRELGETDVQMQALLGEFTRKLTQIS